MTTIKKEVEFQMTLDSAVSGISNHKVNVMSVMVYPEASCSILAHFRPSYGYG